MLAGTFFHNGLGLGFLEEDLDLDLRIVDLDLDLAVVGLVTSLGLIICPKLKNGITLTILAPKHKNGD